MSPSDSVGARLRQARELAGVSARRLDRLAGLAAAHTSHIESGKKASIELSTARKLASTLGISVGWLASGEGPEPRERTVKAAVARAQSKAEASV